MSFIADGPATVYASMNVSRRLCAHLRGVGEVWDTLLHHVGTSQSTVMNQLEHHSGPGIGLVSAEDVRKVRESLIRDNDSVCASTPGYMLGLALMHVFSAMRSAMTCGSVSTWTRGG